MIRHTTDAKKKGKEKLSQSPEPTTAEIPVDREILQTTERILKGIKGGGFTRVFPTLPYKGVKVLNIEDIMNKIYLEQLEPFEIRNLLNLDILSNEIFNTAEKGEEETAFLRMALDTGAIEGVEDIRAEYKAEEKRLLEKGKAIYTEKVEKEPSIAIKDAAEVVDDLQMMEFIYYRQIVLKEDIEGKSKPIEEDGVEMLTKTAQAATSELFKIWLKATKQRSNKDTKAEWLERLADIINKKAIEWKLETEEEQAKRIGREAKQKNIERVPLLNKPDKLKILVSNVRDNLIQSNLDFLKLPVDGQQRFYAEDGERGRRVEERPAKYKDEWGKTHIAQAVYSRVYMTLEKGVTFTDKRLWKVDDTDLTIFTHVITLLAYGNYEMTAEQIYQQITQSERPLPKKWAEKIDLFFIKFSSRRLGIIYEELVKAGMIPQTKENKRFLDKGSWEEQILVYSRRKYINKWGNESYKYIIRDMPFIYIYSEWRDLIISVDMDLLTTGTGTRSNTEDAINIRHYLLMRIGKAKRKKKAKKPLTASDTTILIETLINKSLSPFEIIDRGEGKPREIKAIEISRKKKFETLNTVESILQDLKERKEIKDYSIPKEEKGKGGRFEKIIFSL